MKLIRLIAPSSITPKSEFINRFEDDIIIAPDSEVALVNCTVPLSLSSLLTVDENNSRFLITYGFDQGGIQRTVIIEEGTYEVGNFLTLLKNALYDALNTDWYGVELRVGLNSNNQLEIEFDKTRLLRIEYDTEAYLRYDVWDSLYWDRRQNVLLRDLAVREDTQNNGWAVSLFPASVRCGMLYFSFGTSPNFPENNRDRIIGIRSTSVSLGLSAGTRIPDIDEQFQFGDEGDFGYGFTLNIDGTLSLLHDYAETALIIDRTAAIAAREETDPAFSTYSKNNDIYTIQYGYDEDLGYIMIYRARNSNNVNILSNINTDWNDSYSAIVKTYSPTEPLYVVVGIARGPVGMVSQFRYYPTTDIIDQEAGYRQSIETKIDFVDEYTMKFYGFNALQCIARNNDDPATFQGTSPIAVLSQIPSLAVYLNNLTLECFDGGQNTATDEGRRRSIIGVIPSSTRDQYSIAYEPHNLLWIPIKNKFPINMREIEWGFAEGNQFAPFSTLSSVLVIAIRERGD